MTGAQMLRSGLYPLRCIAGSAIPIRKLEKGAPDCVVVDRSHAFGRLAAELDIKLRQSLSQTINDPLYGNFLPEVLDSSGAAHQPGDGMATLPLPIWQPFAQNAPLLSLFCLAAKDVPAKASRDISLKLRIRLEQKALVGGICFGGYPFLPYRLIATGENSSNFGLPREVRVTCLGGSRDAASASQNEEFLDSETAVTAQELAWHSGFHFLQTDPTLTDTVILHLSDFPRIALRCRDAADKQALEPYEERFGFIIPYLYVFEYRETTRYRPLVAGGFVAATRTPPPDPLEFNPQEQTLIQSRQIEYRHFARDRYYDFTAHSAIGRGRIYLNIPGSRKDRRTALRECFISRPLRKDERVVLFFEQGEEFARCISGMRAFLPIVPQTNLKDDLKRTGELLKSDPPPSFPLDLTQLPDDTPESLDGYLREQIGLPPNIPLASSVRLRVFEVDPPEGSSVFETLLNDKYALPLADITLDEFSEAVAAQWLQGIRFLRPSTARYFAVELTNLSSGRASHIVLQHAELVQSAHVSVHPRPARTQRIRAVHFRFIGRELADDYAKLGNDGFNFAIERVVAGEQKGVLFRANSLFDLVHAGAVRMYSNSRRRATEFEKVTFNQAIDNDAGLGGGTRGYEIRTNEMSGEGWRRSETGSNRLEDPLKGKAHWYHDIAHWTGQQNPDAASKVGKIFGFSTLGNREVRSHSNNLYPEQTDAQDNFNEWQAIRSYFNTLRGISSLGFSGNLVPSTQRLDADDWDKRAWIAIPQIPRVAGQKTLSVNPLAPVNDLVNFVNDVANHRPFDPTVLGFFLLGNIPLLLSGGGNSSMSISPGGVGVSMGIQPVPTINCTYTIGSFGNIASLASEENYSYAQTLNKSFDETRIVTYSKEGVQNRVVTRKEVPGTDAERVRGAEVVWQGEAVDILSGTIPLNLTLPATASKRHARTFDETLRVRIGSGVGRSASVDIWFELSEEMVRDDY
jgi:hypothetical protein